MGQCAQLHPRVLGFLSPPLGLLSSTLVPDDLSIPIRHLALEILELVLQFLDLDPAVIADLGKLESVRCRRRWSLLLVASTP